MRMFSFSLKNGLDPHIQSAGRVHIFLSQPIVLLRWEIRERKSEPLRNLSFASLRSSPLASTALRVWEAASVELMYAHDGKEIAPLYPTARAFFHSVHTPNTARPTIKHNYQLSSVFELHMTWISLCVLVGRKHIPTYVYVQSLISCGSPFLCFHLPSFPLFLSRRVQL